MKVKSEYGQYAPRLREAAERWKRRYEQRQG
jgi:hypothetical protein